MKHNSHSPLALRRCALTLAVAATFNAGSLAVAGEDYRNKQVGRQSDGSVMLSTNQAIKPAGAHIEFRGRPNAVALSPDLKSAAFLNGAYKAIVVLDPATGAIKQEFDAAGSSASFNGIVYSKDGRKLYASQANGRIIIANVATDGMLTLDRTVRTPVSTIPYPGREDGNSFPGGLALSEDGATLYVVLSRNNSLGVLDLTTNQFVGEIPAGNAPHEVVVGGDVAYVSNQGGRKPQGGEFTNDSSGTPIVADRKSGYATTGTVSVIDLNTRREIKAIEVERQPTALLLSGQSLFVANTNSDSVSVIDTRRHEVVKTIHVQPFPGAPFGSSPNGLAMMDDDHLVVSLGRNNALAVYRLGRRGYDAVEFAGLIPTGWYPSDVAADQANRRLVVSNDKGVGSLGPEAKVGPDAATNKTGKWVHSNMGSASVIPFPNHGELRSYTEQVYKNNSWERLAHERGEDHARHAAEHKKPVPVPEKLGEPSVFKHVFYIIKENRTYDQIHGDMPQGNGDPSLVQFGREVTPNHHALAEQFVLFDNLYDSGSNSADGHQWSTQAFVVDYLEKFYGGFIRTYPFNGGDALAYAPSGFLWDNALKHGKKARVYGEYVSGLRADGVEMGPWRRGLGHGQTEAGVWKDFYRDAEIIAGRLPGTPHVDLEAHSDVPSLEAIINKDYPPYHQIIPDQYRTEVFLKEFSEYVKNKNLPELVVMALTSDHTNGLAPNYPTPRAMVADNDLALGRVIEAISHSPYWKDSAIFVIEDDAQNGVDHVDGHRTIGYVVSPYTKRGAVDSRYYTQIDFIRTMEQILGLPPMNQMDLAVSPTAMKGVFADKPDLRPFKVVPNQIALDEMNPGSTALNGIRKEWALASAELDFSKPDAADPLLLNRAIWYSTKGFDKPYPGDERVLRPAEVHAYLHAKAGTATRAD
jgi:YVTN family beta-propeller protein